MALSLAPVGSAAFAADAQVVVLDLSDVVSLRPADVAVLNRVHAQLAAVGWTLHVTPPEAVAPRVG
jgi:hypothetical protein